MPTKAQVRKVKDIHARQRKNAARTRTGRQATTKRKKRANPSPDEPVTLGPALTATDALSVTDQIAMAALTGLLACDRRRITTVGEVSHSVPERTDHNIISAEAYNIADEMMAARKARSERK